MKKILIIIFGAIFIIISCHKKTENILINIKYVGNYDHAMDVFLTNYQPNIKIDNAYQSIYEIEEGIMLEKVKKYVENQHSKHVYKTNKIKVTVIMDNNEKIYFFNADDGIKFINFLIANIKVQNSKTNKYTTNQYFIESELPPFKNHLKDYSGREWMNE